MVTWKRILLLLLLVLSVALNAFLVAQWWPTLAYNRAYWDLRSRIGYLLGRQSWANREVVFQSSDYVLEPLARPTPRYTVDMVRQTDDLPGLQEGLRREARQVWGIDRIPRDRLEVSIVSTVMFDTYTRQRIAYPTQVGVTIPAYLLKPKTEPPWAAVLIVHGCDEGKAGPAGLIDDYHHAIGVHLAEAGFLVLIPDHRGFGELQPVPHYVRPYCGSGPRDGRIELERNTLSTLGLPLRALDVFDPLVAVQLLAEHPDVSSIGIAGVSGGGVIASFVAAMDLRVNAVVMSNAMRFPPTASTGSAVFSGPPDTIYDHLSLIGAPWPSDFTSLTDNLNLVLAALIPPRPLLLQYGDADPINWLRGGPGTVEYMSALYEKANAPDRLEVDIQPGGHEFFPAGVVSFFQRHLSKPAP